jgi:hypothetical protein
MTPDHEFPDASEIDAINAEASVLMKRGIALMSNAGADMSSVVEALDCFDRALAIRLRLPVETIPVLGYSLAACWLNRADALARIGAEKIVLALTSYDEGIALLRRLPLHEDPRFPRRLAIAHQNRGLALRAQAPPAAADAILAFAEAAAVLDRDESAAIPDRQQLLATVWTNLAIARSAEATEASESQAREAALRAIALVASAEATDADSAEVGLKARHVLCQTLASRLPLRPPPGTVMPADVHEATDLADDGLALVRQWERGGVTRFRGLAFDLFRFGARVYRAYQPQFLKEFIYENIDSSRSSPEYVDSPEMRAAAYEAFGMLKDIENPDS